MTAVSRLLLLPGLAAFALLSPGCGTKEEPEPPEEKPAASDEVGVGDAIDYAIGKRQIEIMKESEQKLDRIKKEHDRRLQEALGEQ